ncbi:hypothetical protein BS47DRAFT_283182 [Hydnum rufescens UP504]|uniref:Uncharacterized protein n=1 Tax=Hydnum rufescens UP504 TaxID=1448309 RepID=A0A9P6DQS2_9AGAM|nr:hypothetical protein BS47DRAFT_283182 [Hydnum rufescens UP504]
MAIKGVLSQSLEFILIDIEGDISPSVAGGGVFIDVRIIFRRPFVLPLKSFLIARCISRARNRGFWSRIGPSNPPLPSSHQETVFAMAGVRELPALPHLLLGTTSDAIPRLIDFTLRTLKILQVSHIPYFLIIYASSGRPPLTYSPYRVCVVSHTPSTATPHRVIAEFHEWPPPVFANIEYGVDEL